MEQGREKEAVEYFNGKKNNPDDKHLSPLQRIVYFFKNEEKGKLSIEAHQGFVRLYYQVYAATVEG